MRHGKYRFLAGAILPAVVLYAVFVISPYGQAFYLSLTSWDGVSGQADFVGLDNFARLAGDPSFRRALGNNALMLVVVPLVTIALALFLAYMINIGGRRGRAAVQGARGAAFYKIVYFFPQLLSIAIIAVLWQFVYTPNNGLLNGFLEAVGLAALRRSWLAEPGLALWAVMAVLIWASVGFYVVLFSAAIESIPRDVLEAARVDGAGRFATLWRVTLPMMRENVQVAFVYLGILALDGFPLVHIMTVGPGGPDGATEVMGLALYRNAFTYGRFGYAAAMGVAIFFLTLVVTVFTLQVFRREQVEAA